MCFQSNIFLIFKISYWKTYYVFHEEEKERGGEREEEGKWEKEKKMKLKGKGVALLKVQ